MADDLLQALLADDDSGSKLDQIQRQQLLDTVEDVGSVPDACAECRITEAELKEAIEADPSLGEELIMCQGRFQSKLRRRFRDLALNGVKTPIIGGKERDIVVEYLNMPDKGAMDIVAKMHFSKDMAQYTRQQVETKDLTPKEHGDKVDLSKLTRQERSLFDSLIEKMSGQPPQIEGEKE